MDIIDFFDSVSYRILSDEHFHPEIPEYLEDLRKNIISGYVGKSHSEVKINPVFFRKNKKLSSEIFPKLVENIRNNMEVDLNIESGAYILKILGYSRAGGARIYKGEKPIYFASGNPAGFYDTPELFAGTNENTSYDAGQKFVKLVGGRKLLNF